MNSLEYYNYCKKNKNENYIKIRNLLIELCNNNNNNDEIY